MHDDIGRADQARGLDRQQVRITGACAYEIDCRGCGVSHDGQMAKARL
jgi:hypothetical protein